MVPNWGEHSVSMMVSSMAFAKVCATGYWKDESTGTAKVTGMEVAKENEMVKMMVKQTGASMAIVREKRMAIAMAY
jgi:hypothetical protein